MQYVQRKLQRSVTETRRSEANRPKVSGMPELETLAIGRVVMTASVSGYGALVLRLALSRRWLTALALAALFAVACVFLGQWQWHRHEEKVARAERINSHYTASPVPLNRVLTGVSADLPRAREWTMVTTTGRYADRSRMLVRNRPNHGVFGYEVVVPLALSDGTSLLVDRGWIPNGQSAAEPSPVPATPAGDVTVTGWLRMGEPSFGRRLPTGQLASINVSEARAQTGASLYGAYLIARDEAGTPGQQIVRPLALAEPDTDKGPHLAYALQWWLAAPVGFVLIFFGARRELLERAGTNLPPQRGATPQPASPRARRTRIWDEEDE
jgi:cytochrome oxidase assembly protein ShyY1